MEFWNFLVGAVAGCPPAIALATAGLNREQSKIIAYQRAEILVLREQLQKQLKGKRLLLTNRQRVRLAEKAKALGLNQLRKLEPLVTPETFTCPP